MRYIVVALVLFSFLVSSPVHAKRKKKVEPPPSNTQTLFGNRLEHLGWFGGPVFSLGKYHNKVNYSVGAEAAVLVNRHVFFGLGAYVNGKEINQTNLHMTRGGALMGFYFRPDDLVHLSAKMFVGVGGLADQFWTLTYPDKFVTVEPSFDFMVNVVKHVKVGVGMSYRFVDKINQPAVSSLDLWDSAITAKVQWGWF
ncbi:MAG: hypothetical protein OEZ58_19360 [Gammaproteobacteria bacterium]|nr:hypothetical protein [Gammaproteobacteria bacterium]MDH5731148.1 hypothetical protein [Gammaproteobacteria bacterium]